MPGQAPGAQGLKQTFGMYLKAFPDLRMKVEEMIAERDLVVTRFSGEATHQDDAVALMQLGIKPPVAPA